MPSIVNGRVWTADPARPWADALAFRDGRVTAVGTLADVRTIGGRDAEIDANGGLVTPGFIDSHLHLLAGGFRLTEVQLRAVTTRSAFVESIRSFAGTVPPGSWIT